METMLELENNIIKSRGYVLSEREMRSYCIKGVYNSSTHPDYMDYEYVDRFVAGCFDPAKGEMAISESAIRSTGNGYVRVLSVIVFRDVLSMELFMLANQGLYLPVDRTMNGRMN